MENHQPKHLQHARYYADVAPLPLHVQSSEIEIVVVVVGLY